MYCVKCGVELAESERECPLCKTPVYYPGLSEVTERTYPEFVKSKDEMNPKGLYFIISIIFVMAAIIPTVCDISLNSRLEWSGLIIGGVLLCYTVLVLPRWWKKASPAIFVPVDFLAAAIYIFYINMHVGGKWFFSFALPALSVAAIIFSALLILIYYIKRGRLYIFGGFSIALGLYSLFIEFLLHQSFNINHRLFWSLYPLISFTLFGIALIVIAIVRPFREYFRKIFMI
jgi:hypothetical protein